MLIQILLGCSFSFLLFSPSKSQIICFRFFSQHFHRYFSSCIAALLSPPHSMWWCWWYHICCLLHGRSYWTSVWRIVICDNCFVHFLLESCVFLIIFILSCNSDQETWGTAAIRWSSVHRGCRQFGDESSKATIHIVLTFLSLDGAITGDRIHLHNLCQNAIKWPCMRGYKVMLKKSNTALFDQFHLIPGMQWWQSLFSPMELFLWFASSAA